MLIIDFLKFAACSCNLMGSNSTTCDSNGLCICKTNNIMGEKCTKCKDDLIDFPNCFGML